MAQSAGSQANGLMSLAQATDLMKWSSSGSHVLYHGYSRGTVLPKAQGIRPISEMGGVCSLDAACVPY
jgi:hypothetical protein